MSLSLLLALSCVGAPPLGAHTDAGPDRELTGPQGWRASVGHGRRLDLVAPDGRHLWLPGPALPEVAFAPQADRLAYVRGTGDGELVVAPLPPDGSERVISWEGSVDRPSFSADGRWLAFVSGRTGLASVWAVDLALPNPGAAALQLTNVGLRSHEPGRPPVGFVPPPDDAPQWDGRELSWTAQGRPWSVVVP